MKKEFQAALDIDEIDPDAPEASDVSSCMSTWGVCE